MTRRPHTLAAIAVAAFFGASAYVYGQQAAAPTDHSAQQPEATTGVPAPPAAGGMMDSMKMMEAMKKSNARLDELIAKMNAAKGAAKTDAIADLLTVHPAAEKVLAVEPGTDTHVAPHLAGRERPKASLDVVALRVEENRRRLEGELLERQDMNALHDGFRRGQVAFEQDGGER